MKRSRRSGIGVTVLVTVLWASLAFCQEASNPCPTRSNQKFVEATCVHAIERSIQSGDRELSARLLDNLALNYRKEGRDADAIATYRRRIDLAKPMLPHSATMELARLLAKNGRLEEASSLLSSLVNQSSGKLTRGETWLRGDAELQLAATYVEMQAWGLAEKSFQQSIEDLSSGPGDAPARDAIVGLIRLYVQRGKMAQARETCLKFESLLEMGPPKEVDPCKGLRAANDQSRVGSGQSDERGQTAAGRQNPAAIPER